VTNWNRKREDIKKTMERKGEVKKGKR